MRLLEVDPDLASELSAEERERLEPQIVLPSLMLTRGEAWDPGVSISEIGVQGSMRGFLLLDGAVALDMGIAGQVCTRLITPGELVLLDGWEDDSIPVTVGWTVLEAAQIVLLDDRLLLIARQWPGLMAAMLRRAAQQIRHALLQQAIGQLPRVEDRLLALMWSVADRRGVVHGDEIRVRLPVTHAVLAQMIGARRPTVSLGLRSLADKGLVWSEGGGEWTISRASIDVLTVAP